MGGRKKVCCVSQCSCKSMEEIQGDQPLHKESWTGPVERHRPSSNSICSFVRGGTWGALPEPCEMTSSSLLVCMFLTKLSETDYNEGGSRAWRPPVGPVLTAQQHAAWFVFASRFTQSICDRCERVLRWPGLMWPECVGSSWKTKALTSTSQQTRSSLMPRSRSESRSPRTPSASSSGACSDVNGSAYCHAGAIHTTESRYKSSDRPVISIFHFVFQCDFESSPQWVDGFAFPLTNVTPFCSQQTNYYQNCQ